MRKHKHFKCLVIIISGCLTMFVIDILYIHSFNTNENTRVINKSTTSGYVIKTEGCSIPDLEVTNTKIHKFIYDIRPVVCNDGLEPLFESNLTSIYLQTNVLPSYDITSDELHCCYQYFKRTSSLDVEYSDCITFKESVNVKENEDFLKITCRNHEHSIGIIYEDFFHFISTKFSETQREEQDKELNVLILGLDAMSRINLHRQMTKTVGYLNQLQAVEMLGYNKIADNTFPNLIAVLTGHNQEELRDVCWFHNDDYFDDCEFIWDTFKQDGYVTAFGEDAASIGMFNYLREGFQKQPTDYYYNVFDLEADKHIGSYELASIRHCIGSRHTYKLLLKYSKNYAMRMFETQKKFFGFFWSASLTHDYLNMAKMGDEEVEQWLIELNNSGVLNKTALIFMSDHGMRFGDFRNTYQGVLEDRLPFVFVVLPKWHRDKYSEAYNNLKQNGRRLVTPFDLHETVLHLSNLTNMKIQNGGYKMDRGMSWFTPITEKRTCDDAGIDPHWCTCKESNALGVNDQRIVEAVNFTLNHHINKLFEVNDCYMLKLDSILDGRLFGKNGSVENRTYIDYGITFKTKPGRGIFEATIRRSVIDGSFQVMGSVSRLNLYGDQSKCVTEAYTKLFCFCK